MNMCVCAKRSDDKTVTRPMSKEVVPSNFKIPNVFNYLFNIKTFLFLSFVFPVVEFSSVSLAPFILGSLFFVLMAIPAAGRCAERIFKRNIQYNKLRDRFRWCPCYLKPNWLLTQTLTQLHMRYVAIAQKHRLFDNITATTTTTAMTTNRDTKRRRILSF